jgi:hypothetical protein
MAATERVTILMEPAQKAALTKRARAVGQSVGEYVRNRALDEDEILTALVAELKASTAKAVATVDEALARMDARENAQAERDTEIRRQVEAELSNVDFTAVAELFAPLRNELAAQQKQQRATR